ncbi:unnamed protein product [Haemonchus placei]|uniref:Uncharacterized protein n=1 Tax=Haemonchus placei TaxID=6290 RepID=A0A0N4VTT0_HAEPC|nr:unnamed protein product [Haemonchus placei]
MARLNTTNFARLFAYSILRTILQKLDYRQPIEFDAVNAAKEEQRRERATTHHGATLSNQGQPPKRVEVGDPRFDPLHLLFSCHCGMFNTHAQVGLPGLRCDLARSKPVKNLFELANVASIALHPKWWGGRQEKSRALNKESRYLTIHGLATAIHAHSKFRFDYPTALKAHEDVVLPHPPLLTIPATTSSYTIAWQWHDASRSRRSRRMLTCQVIR